MMGEEIDFRDPTAGFFGPGSGDGIKGAQTLDDRRRETFNSILEFGLEIETSFVTNHHAVYIGRTFYTMPGSAVRSERESVRFEHAAAFVIGVREGKVFYHRDFVDYSDFAAQARSQRTKD